MRHVSTLRAAQYDALRGLSLNGRILDVGGDPRGEYHRIIGGEHSIVFTNIDPNYKPDLLFDVQGDWPVEPSSFDAVLMFNLLEHVFEYDKALAGAYAALKPGGVLVGSVPFMFWIHGHPSDYFRYTRFALERMLTRAGFSDVNIKPLGTGAFSVAYQAVSTPLKIVPILYFFRWVAAGLDRLLWRIKPGNKLSTEYLPLGYHFQAVKSH